MGITKEIVQEVLVETGKVAGPSIAIGAIDGAKNPSGFISKKVSTIVENRNKANLKKHTNRKNHYLFVTKDSDYGYGVYSIKTNKEEEKYNTLFEQKSADGPLLRIYSQQEGEIANVKRATIPQKSLFSKKVKSVEFSLYQSGSLRGKIKSAFENKQKVFVTEFNEWIATGDLEKNNYKIFDKKTGKTVAIVTQKYASASTYCIECDDDSAESTVVAMTLIIDISK